MSYIPKVKKYVMDASLSWEERYRQLERHHELETKDLIQQVDELDAALKRAAAFVAGLSARQTRWTVDDIEGDALVGAGGSKKEAP